MAYGIFLLTLYDEPVEQWLTRYDPDEGDDESVGVVDASDDPADALRFPTQAEAWDCYQQVSTRIPMRFDGRPNRPLTAFTVHIRPLPEGTDA